MTCMKYDILSYFSSTVVNAKLKKCAGTEYDFNAIHFLRFLILS